MEDQHRSQTTKTLRRAALRCILLSLLLFGMLSMNVAVAVPDRTCLSRNLFLTSNYFIGGFPKTVQLTVERVLDNNRVATDADSRSWRYKFPSSGEDRFGAFTCVFNSHEVRITTILLSENGDVTPESPTVTVSVGEDVTLRMNQSFTGSSAELRWKHNGDDVTAWNGLSNVTLTNVCGSNAGIYECYRDGCYDQQRHAIMKLLVRECPAGKWGSLCSGDCPFCWNGGVCDDKTGECICTPGFSGDLCETLNGYNHWGQDGTIQCTYRANSNQVEACRGRLMCHPDPLGCTCATGFTALDCMQDCPNGYFGAGCKHECHCVGEVACDKDDGRCPNGVACATGYTGENCQGCPDGYFGADCRHACHCEGGEVCNKENGKCPVDVQCAAGYRGDNCQNVCPTGKIGQHTHSCVSCLVPVYVSTPARLKNDTNTLEWNQAYSRCPVSEYNVQSKLINKEQCQTVDGDFANLTSVTPTVISYNLSAADSSLHAYSTYKFRVVAINEAGLLEYPEFEIEHTTPEKEPSGPPVNIQPNSKTRYSISFSWNEIPCGQRNGEITKYQIQFRALEKPYLTGFMPNDTYTTDTLPNTTMQYNISGLEPSTTYDIRLAGMNNAGRGPLVNAEMSTSVETDLDPPAKPSYEPSKVTSTTVTIGLSLPSTSPYITGVQVGVRQVAAVVKRETSKLRQPRSADDAPDYVAGELSKSGLPETFTVGDGKTHEGFDNKPLMSGTEYDIFLGSVSRISNEEFSVAWGEPLRVQASGPDPESFPVAAVVVPILIVIILGIFAAGIIFKRRRSKQESSKQRCQFNTENSEIQIDHDNRENVSENSYHTAGAVGETTCKPKTPSTPPPTPQKPKPEPTSRKKPPVAPDPVPLEEFGDYVRRKKAASYKEGNGFLQDYENLPDNIHPCSVARYEMNKEKNRYANIIPYDSSRVVLDELPDDPFSDYINACYMNGFCGLNHYIASQGPNKASTPDMWRMVWQENTAKIVMLTNLQEGIKGKCEKYWPDKAAVYGGLIVRQTSEEQQADFIVRDFTIGIDSEDQPNRRVRQYHYTTWPDMGLPRDPGKVVNFINNVKEYTPKDAGPMIVHCSAGIGRTGVFIALDSMFDQAKKEGKVDIWNFVRGMRERRMKMIQTAAQYEFIFDTLLETFQCGDTTVKPEMLRAAVSELKKKKKGSGKTGLRQQFESLNLMAGPPNTEQCRGGRDPGNVNKNRFPDKIPVDRFRPNLMTAGEEGSTDYINACFLNSFNAKGTYIATQMPLPETVGDIWRMVYDYNSSCVVMLNSWDHKDPSFGQYLPSEKKPISCGALRVTMESTDKVENNITVRYLTLTNNKSQASRMICHLQLLDWPSGGVPSSPASVMKLVTAVREWQSDHEGERIVVHCIDGEGASGTICALLNILERLQDEKVIDVFQAVKKIRENRSGMVETLEQYQFLYAAIQFYLDTNTVYENL